MHEQMTVDRKMRVTQGWRKSERPVLVTERPEKPMSVDGVMRCPVPAPAPASAPLTVGKPEAAVVSFVTLPCSAETECLTEPGDSWFFPWLWSAQSQRFSCVRTPTKLGLWVCTVIFIWCWDLNSHPHGCAVNTLTSRPRHMLLLLLLLYYYCYFKL